MTSSSLTGTEATIWLTQWQCSNPERYRELSHIHPLRIKWYQNKTTHNTDAWTLQGAQTWNGTTTLMDNKNPFVRNADVPSDHFVYAHSQWDTTLHCNVVSHWLDACTKWFLCSKWGRYQMETFFRVTGALCGEFTGHRGHKGQWRGALMFSLICAWTHSCVNNREAGDLERHRVHYDVNVMRTQKGLNEMVDILQTF